MGDRMEPATGEGRADEAPATNDVSTLFVLLEAAIMLQEGVIVAAPPKEAADEEGNE